MIESPGIKTRLENAWWAVRLFRNWPSFIYHYLRAPRRPGVFHLRRGIYLRMRAGTSDFRIVREILVRGEYEPAGFEIGERDVVVDIGAQIGVFTVRAARAARAGRVFSFEPHPDNFVLLSDNVALNDLKQVTVFNRAVAAQPGEHEFFISSFNTGGHSLYPKDGANQRIVVKTLALPDALQEAGVDRIDYLKIDCEGAEREILHGLPDAWIARVRRIVMEVHDRADTTDAGLAGWLRQRGFEVRAEGDMVYARRA